MYQLPGASPISRREKERARTIRMRFPAPLISLQLLLLCAAPGNLKAADWSSGEILVNTPQGNLFSFPNLALDGRGALSCPLAARPSGTDLPNGLE